MNLAYEWNQLEHWQQPIDDATYYPSCLGYWNGENIYEGDTSWLCCLMSDKPDPNTPLLNDAEIPF